MGKLHVHVYGASLIRERKDNIILYMNHTCFNLLSLNDLTDLMPTNSKMFTVVTKDMIKEKFSDVHGVSTTQHDFILMSSNITCLFNQSIKK